MGFKGKTNAVQGEAVEIEDERQNKRDHVILNALAILSRSLADLTDEMRKASTAIRSFEAATKDFFETDVLITHGRDAYATPTPRLFNRSMIIDAHEEYPGENFPNDATYRRKEAPPRGSFRVQAGEDVVAYYVQNWEQFRADLLQYVYHPEPAE